MCVFGISRAVHQVVNYVHISSMAESKAGPSKKAKLNIYRRSQSLFDLLSQLGTSQSASVSVVSNESFLSVMDDTLLEEGSFEVAGNPGSLDGQILMRQSEFQKVWLVIRPLCDCQWLDHGTCPTVV